jgi:hypothetical protein
MAFQLSKIIAAQFVSNAAAALTLTVNAAGTTAAAVPALTQLSLWTCRFTNVSAAPVTLKVYRGIVAAGNVVINTITIPVATAANPYFQWDPSFQLAAGEAIWAIAGTAGALVVTGDGGITT